jgi:hypothetical protein
MSIGFIRLFANRDFVRASTQNPVGLRPCGFDYHLRHQPSLTPVDRTRELRLASQALISRIDTTGVRDRRNDSLTPVGRFRGGGRGALIRALGSRIAPRRAMRPICCPQCGAEGVVRHEHMRTDGRAFTQFYCESCVKAWAERTRESSDAQQLPSRNAVTHWTERYVAAFHLPSFRATKHAGARMDEAAAHPEPGDGSSQPLPESFPHSLR